jgi:flagellar biosynthesis component FlhA
MKLTKEQQQELQIFTLKSKLNDTLIQNLQYGNKELMQYQGEFINNVVKEARKKEKKPEDKFNCNLDLNTFEINFTEKE